MTLTPAMKDMIVKALKSGGLSMIEDIAMGMQSADIDVLIMGLQNVRAKKDTKG